MSDLNPHYDRAKKRLHDGTQNEVARAQAEATLAVAFEQARTADAAELANLITARQVGAFDTAEEYKATRDKIRELAGLPVSNFP